jgi:hypothetical protein
MYNATIICAHLYIYIKQSGVKIPGRHITGASKFWTVAPKIFGSLVCKLIPVLCPLPFYSCSQVIKLCAALSQELFVLTLRSVQVCTNELVRFVRKDFSAQTWRNKIRQIQFHSL